MDSLKKVTEEAQRCINITDAWHRHETAPDYKEGCIWYNRWVKLKDIEAENLAPKCTSFSETLEKYLASPPNSKAESIWFARREELKSFM